MVCFFLFPLFYPQSLLCFAISFSYFFFSSLFFFTPFFSFEFRFYRHSLPLFTFSFLLKFVCSFLPASICLFFFISILCSSLFLCRPHHTSKHLFLLFMLVQIMSARCDYVPNSWISMIIFLQIACKAVALFLHYLYTAAFTWMLCEGIHLYSKIVEVFSEGSKMKYYYALGWGK